MPRDQSLRVDIDINQEIIIKWAYAILQQIVASSTGWKTIDLLFRLNFAIASQFVFDRHRMEQ
jgi:hypothetical protein